MKSLEQEVRAATDDQVNASRLRVRTKVQEVDGELNKFTLAEHLTIVNILGTMVQHRQQVLSQEAAEMQRQFQMKQHQEQLAKQAEQEERAAKARAAMAERAKSAPINEEYERLTCKPVNETVKPDPVQPAKANA